MANKPARHWILTIRHADFTPWLPPGIKFIKGQLERGAGGYLHWQLYVIVVQPKRLSGIKQSFGATAHCEPTRSDAAEEYVWKADTRVEGTQFQLGTKPFQRNSPTDWDLVRDLAKRGQFDDIPSDVFVRCYSQLKNIAKDHLSPTAAVRTIHVYWGRTGTGKSRRAWEEAGIGAYPKDPCTKFWDGYQPLVEAHRNVVIDEFRGEINISHVLRWFDRYPVIVEAKHGATTLSALNIWLTSNMDPRHWYLGKCEQSTIDALMRRLNITHFN